MKAGAIENRSEEVAISQPSDTGTPLAEKRWHTNSRATAGNDRSSAGHSDVHEPVAGKTY